MKRLRSIAGRAPALLAAAGAAIILILLTALADIPSHAEPGMGNSPGLYEDFNELEQWEGLYFPKIKEHSSYSTGSAGGTTYLIANSSASASALVLKREIDVYGTPRIIWRWKVGGVYEKGNLRTKEGDDSPLRVYVMFEYDPERAGAGMRLKYAIAKAIYGQYPPHASLNYLWASSVPEGTELRSAYTERSGMIVMRSGPSRAGQWITEEADMVEDYRRVFGEDPPRRARLAVMNDSDNTGEASVSYMDFIKISSP